MDVYYAFNYRELYLSFSYFAPVIRTDGASVSAGWMMLEALPLLTTPTLIVAMLSPDVREPSRKPAHSPPSSPNSPLTAPQN